MNQRPGPIAAEITAKIQLVPVYRYRRGWPRHDRPLAPVVQVRSESRWQNEPNARKPLARKDLVTPGHSGRVPALAPPLRHFSMAGCWAGRE